MEATFRTLQSLLLNWYATPMHTGWYTHEDVSKYRCQRWANKHQLLLGTRNQTTLPMSKLSSVVRDTLKQYVRTLSGISQTTDLETEPSGKPLASLVFSVPITG